METVAGIDRGVYEMLGLMEPHYPEEPSEAGRAMRRFVFAAGLLLMDIDGKITPAELQAFTALLGDEAPPDSVDIDGLAFVLDARIEALKIHVGQFWRLQVMADVARLGLADGEVSGAEKAFIDGLAKRLGHSQRTIDAILARPKGWIELTDSG